MDLNLPSTGQAYTILRIKRKRNEEPLDALVVESAVRRKKSRAGMDIFQFAQTVEDATWKDELRQKAIQDEISRLSRDTSTSVAAPMPPPVTSSDPNRRYTVVQQEPPPPDPSLEAPARTRADFKVLDAIPYAQDVEPDPAMEKIQDLLNNYLSMQEPSCGATSEEDDYVWDIFYRRPGSMNPLPAGRVIGTLADFPPSFIYDSDSDFDEEEDEADEDSNAEDNYKNDYPDEEEASDSSGDEFHEHSEDDEYYHDAQSDDGDWR